MVRPTPIDRGARQSVVLFACCLSVFVAGLDVTIVNVALPSIQQAFGASVSGLQWTIDAYTVVVACLLVLSGSLADRFGRRRVFQIGLGWRSIFWINVPVVLIAIVLTQRFVPESRAAQPRRLDPAGQLMVIVLLACLTAGIIEGPRSGWGSSPIIALFAVAMLAGIALVVVESRRREPLIDMRYFHSAPFSGAALIGVVALATTGGFLFLNTLYLQQVRGYSALQAGLLTIPMALMGAVFAVVSGRLVARRGPRLPLIGAGMSIATGATLLIALRTDTPVWYLILAYLIFGAGTGLVTPPITNTALSGIPRDQAGLAGAIASTCRQTGAALGVAVTGAIIAASTTGFLHASPAAWAVMAGCGVMVIILGIVSTGRWAMATAERNGARLAIANNPVPEGVR